MQPTLEVTPPGHGPEVWAGAVAGSPLVSVAELVGGSSRLLVLSAHPDDETLGAGRLVAQWAAHRGEVRAVSLTAGEACLDHVGVAVPGLGQLRVAEWRAAVAELGVGVAEVWDLPDGQVGRSVDRAASALADGLCAGDVLLAPWRHDPHPDHAAAGEAAARAADQTGARLLEYPVWMTYWSSPADLARTAYELVRVQTEPAADVLRARALALFTSQQRPLRADLSPVVPVALLGHHERQLLLRPVRGAP